MLTLLHIGTEFQKSVWRCLVDVEYGDTTTYRDLAIANWYEMIGESTHADAILDRFHGITQIVHITIK
tara:strand:- start:1181 stop:1384 length:204 start_codon:yes stop_codon:yes gene_type:complete